jgi:hypothetical protein
MLNVFRGSLSTLRRWSAPAPESLAQLWPLSPGGALRLVTDVYEGRCTPEEAAHIASFATEGYVICPRAVEHDLVDQLVADVRSIARYPGRFVTTEEPLLMAATWIALEDVVRGRGELTYYEGSHRIPHHLFADGSKRTDARRTRRARERRRVHELALRAAGMRKHDASYVYVLMIV